MHIVNLYPSIWSINACELELDLRGDGAEIQVPAPVLAEVVEVFQDELQVLARGLHNQPRTLDAARLLLLSQECLWVAVLGPWIETFLNFTFFQSW